MTENSAIIFGTHQIDFSIVRRERASLEIAVEPDLRVVVAAPHDASIDAIKSKVKKRAAWVRKQQRYFSQYLPRTPDRQYVSGETHLYLGRQYRLKVEQRLEEDVKLLRGIIRVYTRNSEDRDRTRKHVEAWYNKRAKIKFDERLIACLDRFPDPKKFSPKGLLVRSLKQRWGSMSPASRLLLNTRLIQAPVDAIDYVITHELCHIEVPHHGKAFFDLLSQVMPDWEKRKARLEQLMS
ncbi:M48 family metallopeptidase [Terasakiella pusilla]|uniref:M48 family metallopeptidase n=1 Tax=Terasakiella pusilla TaxID=64973 RepID=UPI003AA91AFD